MPSLENLKKQAKALVRLHEERSYHLSAVAREVLPKFADKSDREILGGPFKLTDAQTLIARQHGCATWAELKAKVEAGAFAEPERDPGEAEMSLAIPVLFVTDMTRALAFYEGVLGFTRVMTAGSPPYYAEIRRSGVQFGMRSVDAYAYADALKGEPMLLTAIVRVANAKALYLEFTAAGAEFDTPLRREPWGSWSFATRDPDGNCVGFGEWVRKPA